MVLADDTTDNPVSRLFGPAACIMKAADESAVPFGRVGAGGYGRLNGDTTPTRSQRANLARRSAAG